MNRNILMLILLVLVLATALIAYNKWIMGDTHTISTASTSQTYVVSESQPAEKASVLVEEDISGNSFAAPVIQKNDAQATVPAVSVSEPKAADVKKSDKALSSIELKKEKKQLPPLKLVTKKVLVADVTHKKEKVPAKTVKAVSVTPQLPSISAVAYAAEKLVVSTPASFTYRIFGLKEPDRFVIDVIGTFNDELPTPKVQSDGRVKSIRLGQHDDRVRIVLDLKRGLPENWSASQGKGQLVVDLKKE